MAWERRRQGWFYYRSKRIGDSIVKQYFGNGALASLIAHQDDLRKARRSSVTRSNRRRKWELKRIDLDLEDLGFIVEKLATLHSEI